MTTRQLKTDLSAGLKELYLPAIRDSFAEEAERARNESLEPEQYLWELVEIERQQRRRRKVARLLRESKLPSEKTLESFDRKRLPRKVAAHLKVLCEGSFLARGENVLAFGNPGSGKTHLLCAIGHELVYRGRRVHFTTCNLLVEHLLQAKRDLKLEKSIKRFTKYDALIIDDIGYVQQSREEMEVLFTLLANFYERRSLMITSNLPFSKWEQIFKDPMTTAAAIDRLVHHSIILELNLPSYRLEDSKKKRKTSGSEKK
jgi:DNA replication protein DnaC